MLMLLYVSSCSSYNRQPNLQVPECLRSRTTILFSTESLIGNPRWTRYKVHVSHTYIHRGGPLVSARLLAGTDCCILQLGPTKRRIQQSTYPWCIAFQKRKDLIRLMYGSTGIFIRSCLVAHVPFPCLPNDVRSTRLAIPIPSLNRCHGLRSGCVLCRERVDLWCPVRYDIMRDFVR